MSIIVRIRAPIGQFRLSLTSKTTFQQLQNAIYEKT